MCGISELRRAYNTGLVAVNNVDAIVKLIKESKDVAAAKDALMSEVWQTEEVYDYAMLLSLELKEGRFQFTEAQAKAILDMRLARLTGLEKKKVEDELAEFACNIREYSAILASSARLTQILKEELLELKEQFPSQRLTKVELAEEEEVEDEELIPEEEMVVTFTTTGYVKRVPLSVYKAQRRGGKKGKQILPGGARCIPLHPA